MGLRALVAAMSLLAVPASAAAEADAPWVGFNDISSVAGAVPYDTAARAAADGGATSTRIIVDWSWIEATDDVYTWGVLDGVYRADLARGLRPLIGITGAPRWAWPKGARCAAEAHCAYPPGRRYDADYQELLRNLTRRYPQAVAIEIGNEPNLSWAWAGGLSPARYTQLLKRAYRAVKSVDPAMPVLSGGLAAVMGENRTRDAIGLRRFLQAMYDNGAKGSMDGISVHPYPRSVNFANSFAALSVVKDVRSANGDSVPLWVTEMGMTTSVFSAYEQAITLPALRQALLGDPEIRGVYLHTLYDDPTNSEPEERGYGLLGADGTPKPAYCALARASGSRAPCSPGGAVATPTPTQSARWRAQVLLQSAADAARRFRLRTGSYAGLTTAALNKHDPRLSARPPAGSLIPGAGSDPSRIGVFPFEPAGLVLCNASEGGRSYCLGTVWGKRWAYASGAGSLFETAGAMFKGASDSW